MPGRLADEVPLADKVACLAAAPTYPERPERVEVRETHMSFVFLTNRFAYKLKKPVRHPLVDLRRIEARRRNCLTEIGLNRRLAPDVYLGLRPLTFAPQRGLRLADDGRPVEWLVAMRRLPAPLMLDQVLREGGPEPRDLERVARRLANFYGGLPPASIPPEARRAQLESEIGRSRQALLRPAFGRDQGRIDRVAGRLIDHLRAHPELMIERHRAGRIVEGHGDLRPEHIGLERTPVVIDCLEFSRALRLVDPADELAFLALESAMLGDAEAGARLQRRYEAAAGDRPPERLVAWYGSYRALLRARLSALHSLEPGARPPAAWLAQADRYLEAALDYGELLA
jgi:aminoglycoside phosphotransferase family enzyme